MGLGPQPREGADAAIRLGHAILQHAVGGHHGSGAQAHILQHAVGADLHTVGQFHLPLEYAAHIDLHIAAAAQFAAHVDACRVQQVHAGFHQLPSNALLQGALLLGQLQAIIDARHFHGIFCDDGRSRHPVADRQRDAVGEVVLAGRIVVADARQPVLQRRRRGGQHAGIHLVDGALLRVGILLLDDRRELVLFVAQHPPVTAGVIQADAQQTQAGGVDQGLQSLRANERYVSVEHQHARVRRHLGHGLLHGVAGAQLF